MGKPEFAVDKQIARHERTRISSMGSRKQQNHENELGLETPQEFADRLADEHVEENRRRLAEAAGAAALEEIPDAYRNPHVRQAAITAARMALGFKPLPQQEGEQ